MSCNVADKSSSLECKHCGKVALGDLFIIIIVCFVSNRILPSDFLEFKDGKLKCFSHTAEQKGGTKTLPDDVPAPSN